MPGLSSPPNAMSRLPISMPGGNERSNPLIVGSRLLRLRVAPLKKAPYMSANVVFKSSPAPMLLISATRGLMNGPSSAHQDAARR